MPEQKNETACNRLCGTIALLALYPDVFFLINEIQRFINTRSAITDPCFEATR